MLYIPKARFLLLSVVQYVCKAENLKFTWQMQCKRHSQLGEETHLSTVLLCYYMKKKIAFIFIPFHSRID